jgi:hypothetical protein
LAAVTGLLAVVVAAAPLKLAAPGFTCAGVTAELCAGYLDHFAAVLSSERLHVTSSKDIASVLGLERQKELLGCGDHGACLAELAGALGVEGVLIGNLVKTESSYLTTIKVVHVRDGSTWVEATSRPRSEDALFAFLDDTAHSFGEHLAPAPNGGVPRWAPTLAAGVLFAAGVGVFAWAKADAAELADVQHFVLTPAEVHQIADRGRVTEPLGAVLLGAGLAALAGAIVYWVLSQ